MNFYIKNNGKDDIAKTKQLELDKYNRIDTMLEKSMVTSKEAIVSVKHPKIYKSKIMRKEVRDVDLNISKYETLLDFTSSTIDNMIQVYKGDLEIDDAVVNIIEETGKEFVIDSFENIMTNSGRDFIYKAGKSCLPKVVVSFAVESYDDVVSYIKGDIDEYELADALGEDAINVGEMIVTEKGAEFGLEVGASIGATIGSAICPGVGTIIGGAAGGIVGSMVGATVAAEAYNATVDYISEHSDEIKAAAESGLEAINQKADELADKAKDLSADVVSKVAEIAPEAVEEVKSAFATFSASIKLPFTLGK